LKAETKNKAICCDSTLGPGFSDITVQGNCNANTDSSTGKFGSTYTNDTGLDEEIFFTGSKNFQVKEIEIFEISGSYTLKVWTLAVPSRQLESRAFWDFPAIFAEFKEKQFTLLWRGSRDGFGVGDFHKRCDGHANTLTVILDTNGNIFGGFTPVKWESSIFGKDKADPSQKSFLFTLKNPHDFPARRFELKAETKNKAICCDSTLGPGFGDITVQDNCNTNADSWTGRLGSTYTNDTGLDEEIFFTGSNHFQVKEVEVFEISGSYALKAWTLGVPSRKVESRAFWDFPAIFDEFKGNQFTLLWRGSGDGFGVRDFHSRCDGHANTLVVILDTNGNIFGGYTPVAWESRVWNGKPRAGGTTDRKPTRV
jgi:hypothetical protein